VREVIRSNDVEIKTFSAIQVIIRGSGDSKFNNLLNKKLKLLPPSDNLRVVSDDSHILAKLSFDQWNLIFLGKNEDLKAQNLCQEINENSDLLATNISDAQVFFQISGENTYSMLSKLTHFDFREKNFKPMTAAQTLMARIDCSFYKLNSHLLVSCNRSFSDYLEDRLIDAVNF
jgi:heterotetrameric sarcosine oxidase gamma subunit